MFDNLLYVFGCLAFMEDCIVSGAVLVTLQFYMCFAYHLPCTCHALAMHLPCTCHALARHLPCTCHALLAMRVPCACHALAMRSPCTRRALPMHWPCCVHHTFGARPGTTAHRPHVGISHLEVVRFLASEALHDSAFCLATGAAARLQRPAPPRPATARRGPRPHGHGQLAKRPASLLDLDRKVSKTCQKPDALDFPEKGNIHSALRYADRSRLVCPNSMHARE